VIGSRPGTTLPGSYQPPPETLGRPPIGLTHQEVDDRIRRGLTNATPPEASRPVGNIIRGNLFTPFNLILGSLLAITIVIGPIQDAAFGAVLVCNLLIGTVQELRAKRTLDRIAILNSPTARVLRDSVEINVQPAEVVVDDILVLASGDQAVADASVLTADGMEVNEALVTGESEAIAKAPGDRLLAGSFVVAGGGKCRVTAVGLNSYGEGLALEARRGKRVHSELVSSTNLLLRVIGFSLLPMGMLLIITQLRANDAFGEAVRSSIAGVVTMIPQGLVLLTSVAFAVAAIRLARQDVVVSELASVEPLARVDTLCIDKTGTLTTGLLELAGVDRIEPEVAIETALFSLAALEGPNNMIAAALRVAFANAESTDVQSHVPFSSSRRWSAVQFRGGSTWILGAPEVVGPTATSEGWKTTVAARIGSGQRVLLLCRSAQPLGTDLPSHRSAAAVLAFNEQIRDGVKASLRYLMDAGVAVKVLSGDNPQTVSAVCLQVGLPVTAPPVDASQLGDDEHLAEVISQGSVFGRVDPHQKRSMIRALQNEGHVVGMTGDGVNDVLALRDADLGIALGSGAAASRGVARIILLDGTLASLPAIVGAGRRVLANVERVASLFVTKTIFASVLILFAAWAALPFPLLLRHLTVVDAVAIGIPGFVLALPPTRKRWHPGFLRRTLAFAVPAGLVSGLATAFAYETTINDFNEPLSTARSVAALVLAACALWLVYILSRDRLVLARVLTTFMVALFVTVLAVPPLRVFFSFELPSRAPLLAAAGVVTIAIVVMELGWRAVTSLSRFSGASH
jgi:cation-transporting P-type ATPase E